MGRFVSVLRAVGVLLLITFLLHCGKSNSAVSSTPEPVPLKIALSPANISSLEVGKPLGFSASAANAQNSGVSVTFSYQSSNTQVLTISTGGLACAGSWDSLTNPQICTPGPVGVAQVTATAQGVSSPPATVYVHQHVDSVAVSPIAGQTPQTASCFSKGQVFNYQAAAYSRGGGPSPGLDITSTVGPFTWNAVNASVVTLNASTSTTPLNGLLPGQLQATANVPGTTAVYASVSGVNSVPFNFNTCLVQSISLAVTGNANNAIGLARGGSATITATVLDTRQVPISGSFLTWCSSNPASATISTTNCSPGSSSGLLAAATQSGGGTSIIASCTPPNCNIGQLPSLPIYPPNPISISVTGGSTASTSTLTTWVTTTDCNQVDGCTPYLAPITSTTTNGVTTSKLGTLLALPAPPNSMLITQQGTTIFLGTDHGQLGTRGLMVVSTASNSSAQYPSAVGKVLAVSPTGQTVIVSDTTDLPNQVYVLTCSGSTGTGATASGPCGNAATVALNIAGANAAAFSPDGLKAYIVAGTKLYVYSQLEALKTISLNGPVNDVSFLANGAFAYFAGGDPAGVTVRRTCDNALAPDSAGTPQIIATTAVPPFLKALPDGTHVLAVNSPGIDIITASNINTDGCTPTTSPVPTPPYLSNGVSSSNLGQGNFVPTQLLVSSDGSTAYLLTSNSGSILVFNIAARTTSAIALAGNALPLQASLSPDGTKLFAAGGDGMVHVLDTVAGSDQQQISFPQDLGNLNGGLCTNVSFVCNPELIAVAP
jgi:hypothetical protein